MSTQIKTAPAVAVTKTKMGTYKGNGLPDRTFTGLGFQPDILILIDHANGSGFGWGIKTSTMAGRYSHYATGGYIVEFIVSLDADGFTLGTNHTYVNNPDKRTYTWIAIKTNS